MSTIGDAVTKVADSTPFRALERILVVLLSIVVSISIWILKEKNDTLMAAVKDIAQIEISASKTEFRVQNVESTLTALQVDRATRIAQNQAAQTEILQRVTAVETNITNIKDSNSQIFKLLQEINNAIPRRK